MGSLPRSGLHLAGLLLALALPARSAAVEGALALEAGPELVGGEYYATLAPALLLDAEFLSLELQVPLRLRLNRALASERGVVRAEDWDALSDAGRALRRLDLSLGERTFTARLGALAHRSLGHGTVVHDFGNALLPDAQPVGLAARLAVGPVAAEAIASDVLGAEVTALAVALEPLSLWGEPNDRLHLAVAAALDWTPRARSARRFGVFGASLDGIPWRTGTLKLAPYVDFNSTSRGGHGLHLGLLCDVAIAKVELGLRAEYRHTRGPYQPEYFDLAHPLERASGLVPLDATAAAPAKADVPWGTDDTWRAELRLRAGPATLALDLRSRGRDPLGERLLHDASAVAEVEAGPVSVAAFAAARQFAWGHNPARVLAFGEARYRFTPYLHAWTVAGRLYRLAGEGAPGAMWQLGAGFGGALGF